jgi:hypothetical protein
VEQLANRAGVVSVRSGTLRVRVGSQVFNVDPMQCEVQTRLPRGTEVEIIGRQGDWLKIVPPAGVYAYVGDRHVARISDDIAARLRAAHSPASQPGGPPSSAPAIHTKAERPRATAEPDPNSEWGQRLLLAEAAIQVEARKPVLEQSWTEAMASLRPIADQQRDPTAARLASAWIGHLQERIADQAALRAAHELDRQETRVKAQTARELERLQQARQKATSRPSRQKPNE